MNDMTKISVFPTCPYCDLDRADRGIIEIEPYAGKGNHTMRGSKIFVCEECLKSFVVELEVEIDIFPYKISKYDDVTAITAPPTLSASSVSPAHPQDPQT